MSVLAREHKRKLLDEAQALLGYHRKAAIRALGGACGGPGSVDYHGPSDRV